MVTDTGDSTFATGEAVNLAARLQQNADPGQILVGPAAHRLTLGRIEVEEIGPVDVRGREEPVWAWAAVAADGRQPARVAVTPLIGREHELELLENTFARAVRDRRAHLFTVYGEPGVGKTRLTNEFLASLEGTTILSGRCLPYGESITYWPLAEMVKGAADIADDDPLDVAIAKLRDCCPADAVADLLGLATGVLEAVHGERSQQEIAWAAREWAQLMAQTQPLILVFEDIHWAEEPLLELIEHMTDWVREGSLLIVCLSRPELLDIRSDWGGGRVRATSIELEPLGEADSEQLIDALSEVGDISPATRRALLEKTGGNPLFLEEVMLTVAECGEEQAAERDPGHAAGSDRRAHRSPRPRIEGLAAAGICDRPQLLGRRARIPRRRAKASARRSKIFSSATSSSSSCAHRSRTRPLIASSTSSSAMSPTRA